MFDGEKRQRHHKYQTCSIENDIDVLCRKQNTEILQGKWNFIRNVSTMGKKRITITKFWLELN